MGTTRSMLVQGEVAQEVFLGPHVPSFLPELHWLSSLLPDAVPGVDYDI